MSGGRSAVRLLRSVLFCPGDREKVLRKAATLQSDVVVLDLEDAVGKTDAAKASARDTVAAFLHGRDAGADEPHYVVRINCPFTSPWGEDDIAFLTREAPAIKPSAVILPKVEDTARVRQVAGRMADGGVAAPLWAMVETAQGVLDSRSIAREAAIDTLVFGANDLTKDIKAKHTAAREPLLYSMSHTILAARAAGKRAVDGVHIHLEDTEGLQMACQQGRELGFDGKSLIHPNQIEVTNRAFSPSSAEIAEARAIVDAWVAASAAGSGVVKVNGRLVEDLHVEQAQILLDEADEIARVASLRGPQQ